MIKIILHSDSLSFYLICISCSRIPFKLLHYISLSYLLRLLLAVTVSQTFLVFDDHDRFEECLSSYFVKCLSTGIFLLSFSMIRQVLLVFGSKTTKVKCHLYHMIAKVHAIITTYHC